MFFKFIICVCMCVCGLGAEHIAHAWMNFVETSLKNFNTEVVNLLWKY